MSTDQAERAADLWTTLFVTLLLTASVTMVVAVATAFAPHGLTRGRQADDTRGVTPALSIELGLALLPDGPAAGSAAGVFSPLAPVLGLPADIEVPLRIEIEGLGTWSLGSISARTGLLTGGDGDVPLPSIGIARVSTARQRTHRETAVLWDNTTLTQDVVMLEVSVTIEFADDLISELAGGKALQMTITCGDLRLQSGWGDEAARLGRMIASLEKATASSGEAVFGTASSTVSMPILLGGQTQAGQRVLAIDFGDRPPAELERLQGPSMVRWRADVLERIEDGLNEVSPEYAAAWCFHNPVAVIGAGNTTGASRELIRPGTHRRQALLGRYGLSAFAGGVATSMAWFGDAPDHGFGAIDRGLGTNPYLFDWSTVPAVLQDHGSGNGHAGAFELPAGESMILELIGTDPASRLSVVSTEADVASPADARATGVAHPNAVTEAASASAFSTLIHARDRDRRVWVLADGPYDSVRTLRWPAGSAPSRVAGASISTFDVATPRSAAADRFRYGVSVRLAFADDEHGDRAIDLEMAMVMEEYP